MINTILMSGNTQILASSLDMLENRFCVRIAASFVSPLTIISKLLHRLPVLPILTCLVIHGFSEGQKESSISLQAGSRLSLTCRVFWTISRWCLFVKAL